MRKTIPKSVKTILSNSSSKLQDMLTHQSLLANYQICINSLLDSRLQENCTIANIRGEILVLQASSAAWAARLRLHTPEILNLLNKTFACGLSDYKILIRPVSQKAEKPSDSRRMQLSASSRRLLSETAQGISDPELSAALHRLSRSTHKDN